MRLARVKGTVTATAKPDSLTGRSLLLVDIVDADDTTIEAAQVAVDACGAGTGDLVLLAQGSAARLSADTSGAPIDCAVIAVVDSVDQ
jgi:microcompartment protein CcmK/EutM